MPNVPYSPVPDVSPSTQGTPGFDIHASPDMFGAGVGQAVQGLGQTVQQGANVAAQQVIARQGMTNEATSTEGQVNLDKTYTDLYSKYAALQGKDAVDAKPAFMQSLQDARDAALQGMPNAQAQSLLAKGSMYLLQRTMMLGAGHADTQEQQYWVDTKQAAIDNAARQGAFLSNSPGQVAIYANQTADAATEIAKHQGMSDQKATELRAQKLGGYYRTVIGTLAQTDPTAASTLFDGIKGYIDGPSQDAIGQQLHHVTTTVQGVNIAQEELARGGRGGAAGGSGDQARAGGGATPTTVFNALIGTEASGPAAVSAKGASGTPQIIESTFNQYKLPGETYGNNDDRIAAAHRYVDDMWKKYPGDPARVAVGYFSGVGNVAPAGSPTPWIEDKSDGISTTSQYVARFTGKLGNQPAGAATPQTGAGSAPVLQTAAGAVAQGDPEQPPAQAPAQAQGDSRSAIMQRTIDRTSSDPMVQEAAVRHLDMVFRAQDADRIDAERDRQVRQQMAKDASDAEEMQLQNTLATHPDQVTAQGILTDKKLLPDAQRRMVNFVEAQTKPDAEAHLSAVTMQGLETDLHRPYGDPKKINEMAPIVEAFTSGRLSKADYAFMKREFQDDQSEDGQRLGQEKEQFLEDVKSSIVKSNPLMGQIDMTGGLQFNLLRKAIEKKIGDYRKANQDPHDLFDPSKPDFVGTPDALAPYQKSIPESIDAYTARMRQQQTQQAAAAKKPPAAAAPAASQAPPSRSLDDIFGGPPKHASAPASPAAAPAPTATGP
jgi:hypothetical protein